MGRIIQALLLGATFLSYVAIAREEYRITANPDAFSERSLKNYFFEASDTHQYQWNGCYRRIEKPRFVRIVCTGKIQQLIHGGIPSWRSLACRHDFWLRKSGKYLVAVEPECTN